MKGYGGIYIWEYIWKHMALIVAYGTIWRHMERRIDGNANVDICVIYEVNKDMSEQRNAHHID